MVFLVHRIFSSQFALNLIFSQFLCTYANFLFLWDFRCFMFWFMSSPGFFPVKLSIIMMQVFWGIARKWWILRAFRVSYYIAGRIKVITFWVEAEAYVQIASSKGIKVCPKSTFCHRSHETEIDSRFGIGVQHQWCNVCFNFKKNCWLFLIWWQIFVLT